MSNYYRITDAPFSAIGDGVTNDRAAIQSAIDTAYENGGGTVVIPANRVFATACLVLRDNVELHFEDGAELRQIAGRNGYTKWENGIYEAWEPLIGHNQTREGIIWDHTWLSNFPFLYAPDGTKNVRITGRGTLRMDTSAPDCGNIIHVCPVGFFRVNSFEISDITICDYHSYAMMLYTVKNGLVKNVTVRDFKCCNNDGLSLMNAQNIRITGCDFNTGDDSLYIFESYRDNRGGTWWSSENPEPSYNIEIDHCTLVSNHCKAFAFILWGYGCPDRELVDVRDIYVHDNRIATMGAWYRRLDIPSLSHIRFWNNRIDAIEKSFFELNFNDVNFYQCMRTNRNPCFHEGRTFWTLKPNDNPFSVGVCRDTGVDGKAFGYLDHLEDGDCALYQGVYLEGGNPITLRFEVKTEDNPCLLFVRDMDTGETVAERECSHPEWAEEKLTFTVPRSANYHLGVARGSARRGFIRISNMDIRGSAVGAFGYDRADRVNDLLLFFYDTEQSKLQGEKNDV